MTDAPDGQAVAAAVVVSNGRVLLVRRQIAEGELSWQFPAGKVEPGESDRQAAGPAHVGIAPRCTCGRPPMVGLAEPGHLGPGLLHQVEQVLLDQPAAEAVQQQPYPDARAGKKSIVPGLPISVAAV